VPRTYQKNAENENQLFDNDVQNGAAERHAARSGDETCHRHHKRQKAFSISLAHHFSQREKDKTRTRPRKEREDFSKLRWVHGWR